MHMSFNLSLSYVLLWQALRNDLQTIHFSVAETHMRSGMQRITLLQTLNMLFSTYDKSCYTEKNQELQ